VTGQTPNYDLIRNLAGECRMPLCYGGGIKSVDELEKVIGFGVEKVAVSSAAIKRTEFIKDCAKHVGSQSVVVVIDVKRREVNSENRFEVFTHNGSVATGLCAVEFALRAQDMGAGEIIVNSIDQDGTMDGYDLELINRVKSELSIPMTVLGGAGNVKDLMDLINRYGIIGVSAGSLFCFQGRFKSVLIQYPNEAARYL
jgi:cyclase